MNIFKNLNIDKLKTGLTKTRNRIFNSIQETFTGKTVLDETSIDKLEEILISSDIGFDITEKIIQNVKKKLKNELDTSGSMVIKFVREELELILNDKIDINHFSDVTKAKPYVILVIGVNGVGKTTTIGKLAHNFKQGGAKVLVGAADTFRAAAGEQLDIWAKRADVDIVQKPGGSDPSSVAFETINKAINENYDVVIIDTAGRLHNKVNLMNELNKIKKAISKMLPDAPHETFLVLDGTVGQNANFQAQEFSKVTDITGLVITKLDGTAKGGSVIQICAAQKIPVKYIGVGEQIDDLQNFDPKLFIDAILTA
jgi:fused signal recognition particle receptor